MTSRWTRCFPRLTRTADMSPLSRTGQRRSMTRRSRASCAQRPRPPSQSCRPLSAPSSSCMTLKGCRWPRSLSRWRLRWHPQRRACTGRGYFFASGSTRLPGIARFCGNHRHRCHVVGRLGALTGTGTPKGGETVKRMPWHRIVELFTWARARSRSRASITPSSGGRRRDPRARLAPRQRVRQPSR
jgi:hypothetical protein